ncbi:MAG: adenylate kinase [Vicinamibacterales bacterium]
MALNLIFLGPPGAGKGTQADRFARGKAIPKISTGDILREAVANQTAIGLRAKAIMDRGELVSDEIIIGIVRERLDRPDVANGFILDGFPRTVAQAAALDGLMVGRSPLIVIDIQVADEELVRRLTGRLICGTCGANAPEGLSAGDPTAATASCVKCGGSFVQRADDNEAVVRERLRVYQANTKPLVDYYQRRPGFCAIDGSQTPARVAEMIEAAVASVTGSAEVRGQGA